DQVNYRLGLSEVHFTVEKGALCEFTWTRRARTGAQALFKDLCRTQRSSVATDLDQILSGVTGRRTMDRKHYLIDQPALWPKNLAKMLHARLEFRWRLFAMEDFVRYADCIRAGDADKRNCAFTGRSRDGSDRVRNGHNPSKVSGNRLSSHISS